MVRMSKLTLVAALLAVSVASPAIRAHTSMNWLLRPGPGRQKFEIPR